MTICPRMSFRNSGTLDFSLRYDFVHQSVQNTGTRTIVFPRVPTMTSASARWIASRVWLRDNSRGATHSHPQFGDFVCAGLPNVYDVSKPLNDTNLLVYGIVQC